MYSIFLAVVVIPCHERRYQIEKYKMIEIRNFLGGGFATTISLWFISKIHFYFSTKCRPSYHLVFVELRKAFCLFNGFSPSIKGLP